VYGHTVCLTRLSSSFAIWKDFCAEFSAYENARTSHNGQLAPEKRVRRGMSLRDIEWLCLQLASFLFLEATVTGLFYASTGLSLNSNNICKSAFASNSQIDPFELFYIHIHCCEPKNKISSFVNAKQATVQD
jgi:hypothetical protein